MRVLVTGANGQLGYDVMQVLESNHIESFGMTRALCDIRDYSKVKAYMTSYNPSVVIHCAAYTHVDTAEQEIELCREINVNATKNICEVCAEINAVLVYISTDYVFSGEGHEPYEVDSPPYPINVYGKSKLDGELIVKSIMEKYFIVRTSWAFGVNGDNFVEKIIKLNDKYSEINVVVDQIGSPTYTVELANLIFSMIHTNYYGTYHATNEGFCSWADFAAEVISLLELPIKVNGVLSAEYSSAARRPLNSRLSKRSLNVFNGIKMDNWKLALKKYLDKSY